MAMVQASYGYDAIKHADHTEVKYDRVGGGSGSVRIYRDKLQVGDQEYSRDHIGGVYAKMPDSLAKEIGFVPQAPKGVFAVVGFLVGGVTKRAMMTSANEREWSVWFAYGEKDEYPLAWGFGKARADALEHVISRLLRS